MTKGVLRAISIETYGIFSGKNLLREFRVESIKSRKKIDALQGQEVDFDKDISPLLE